MKLRFIFESTIGFLGLVFILILGTKGTAILALLALLPIILGLKKFKPDERELQLFYRAGNLTLGFVIIVFVLYNYSGYQFETRNIMENWLPLLVSLFFFLHGIAGIFIFTKN